MSYRDDPNAAAEAKSEDPFGDEHAAERAPREYSDYSSSSPTVGGHARKPSAATVAHHTSTATAGSHPSPASTGLSNSVLSAGEGSAPAVHTKDWASTLR